MTTLSMNVSNSRTSKYIQQKIDKTKGKKINQKSQLHICKLPSNQDTEDFNNIIQTPRSNEYLGRTHALFQGEWNIHWERPHPKR